MYSRIRARVPSARQGGEQYDRGLPCPAPAGSAPPQMRHTAVPSRGRRPAEGEWDGAGAGGEEVDGAGDREGLRLRARPLFRHASEQYRTDRLGVWNGLPHALHRTRCTRAASLSALFSHRAQ